LVDALVRTVEQIIARIAGRQHGIVTWAEMVAAGISAEQIRHRVNIGALIRVHRGVYSVGHRALTTEARYLAAVKACGPGAVLCGRAAAYLLGILKAAVPPPPEVMTPTERRVTGVKTKRVRRIDRRDVATVKGIPCTTVPRTLVDLAADMDDDPFARLCHEAGVKYGTTPRHVKAVMARRGRTTGAARIRRVMEGDTKVALSVLEHGFLDILKAEGHPLPDTNKTVDNRRVDCHWADPPVTIELVSFKYHNSRWSWESDHDREREARQRGDEWRSFTYKDVFEDQTYMLGELRKLLRRPAVS
jgi:hypothetical protein